jgi:RAD54-like protein 2
MKIKCQQIFYGLEYFVLQLFVFLSFQIGGVRFLYDNLVESINRFKTSHGFGCILAHSMGLGKTIQMVSFIDIFLRNTDARNVLVIVPINTLQNWLAEFAMWVPERENVDESKKDEVWPREFCVNIINDNHKTTKARAAVVRKYEFIRKNYY